MTQQLINVGTSINDGTGDPLRTAMEKSNSNFTELYTNDTLLAPLLSPVFTGTPTAPTAANGTNTTQVATTAFVQNAVSVAISPYAPLSSPAFTGTPTAPTAALGTNTTQIATTAFVQDALASGATLNSPAFTGTPTAPTAAAGTNTTQLATTAFVETAVSAMTASINQNVTTATAGQTVFNTPSTYAVGQGQTMVFINGLRVLLGTDYTESSTTTITLVVGVTAGTEVAIIVSGQLTNTPNTVVAQSTTVATAGQTIFTTPANYTPGTNSVIVFLNGARLALGTDYTESSVNSITFTNGVTAGGEVGIYLFSQVGNIIGAANPMVSPGDLIVGGGSGSPTRLGLGANGAVLAVRGGAATWASPGLTTVIISTNTTATQNNMYGLTAALTLTLPASPAVNDVVGFVNLSGLTSGVNVDPGTNLIRGTSGVMSINSVNASAVLTYSGAAEGWI